jgi:hypothetical protein
VTDALVLFARAPRRGAVKTRLVPPLDPDEALALHMALLEDSLALLRRAARRTGAHPFVSFSDPWEPPAEGAPASLARALSGLDRLPQRGADLGERLLGTFGTLLDRAHRRVVIFGSDSPTLPDDRPGTALERLRDGADLVLGPAEDGGYYLIGAARVLPEIFRGIAWGTDQVMRQTLAGIGRAGARAELLSPWYDVDRPVDLLRLWQELDATPAPHAGQFAPCTAALLHRLARCGRLRGAPGAP